ncbi:hypothetical protein DPMN_047840 [Dreissena polymorpha]|uniref:Uncharacterized protein n=1 Tax=Dreissena polymorpha TaxID=45954 RepID=A0A9D4D8G2_DREPO|nr:hypothetical protein DPMN_047840 [Dreissena polymorpha]
MRFLGVFVTEANLVTDVELVVAEDVVDLAHCVLLVIVWAQSVSSRNDSNKRGIGCKL